MRRNRPPGPRSGSRYARPLASGLASLLLVACPDDAKAPLGSVCRDDAECASGLCVPSGGAKICALQCGAGKTCDDGFTCNSSSNICLEDSGGGCSTGGGSETGYGGWLALGLAALFCARRRRLSA